jgi:thioredoxin-related protein
MSPIPCKRRRVLTGPALSGGGAARIPVVDKTGGIRSYKHGDASVTVMKTKAVLLIASAALIFPAAMEARTWKEAGSDRTLQGEYLKTEGENVVITKPNGSTVKIPLAKLSGEDQKFVAEKNAAKPAQDKAEEAADKDVFKWETDLEVAKKRAKAENKKILADFTGSDWCGWCIKLKKEVFDTPEFQEYAKKHLVMLELDFPKRTELPAELKEQNDKLAQEFQVQGFPTILLMNSRGKEVGRTGYQEGGPEKYIEHLKEILK